MWYSRNYTDAAIESIEQSGLCLAQKKTLSNGIEKTVYRIDSEENAKRIGRAKGVYVSFDVSGSFFNNRQKQTALASYISSALRELSAFRLTGKRKLLVVGLGNEGMTADSLGPKVLERLNISLDERGGMVALAPSVQGVTGIESYEIVKGVCERIEPEQIVIIDTLASSGTRRLYSSFQLTTAGIVPGGGVGNGKPLLSYQTLKAPVIAVGVPLVLYARTLVFDSLERYCKQTSATLDRSALNSAVADALQGEYGLVVTPKEIDLVVNQCADVLAAALNKAFARSADKGF